MNIDTTALKQISIAAVVQRDLGPAKAQRGHHLLWLCPFHDDHHPSLDANTQTNRVFCNVCGISLNPVGWVMKFSNIGFVEAASQLGGLPEGVPSVSVQSAQSVDKPYAPPSSDWMGRAENIVQHCAAWLWADDPRSERVRAYLIRRGLSEQTLRYWQVGYNPGGRNLHGLWVWPGIIIPAHMGGVLWGIKIRLLPEHPYNCLSCRTALNAPGRCPKCGTKNKYRQVKGSEPALFGADTCKGRRVVFGAEGEFDGMLVYQEASDLGGMFTSTNGAGKRWRAEWFAYLLDGERIILLFDNDEAGDNGKAKFPIFGGRAYCARVPDGKDVTDYAVRGGSVFTWLSGIRRAALAEMFGDVEAHAAYINSRFASAMPPALEADYRADLAELLVQEKVEC